MLLFLSVLCGMSLLWWGWTLYAVLRSRAAIEALRKDQSPEPPRWPLVCLVIAARDEEGDLERSVTTRLADDYPNLQVIIVNDRSTDRTAEIADRLARQDPRVKAVHIKELPAGWLGKVHAMCQGVAIAEGEWLLFSDADVEFAPGTLRRAIARCEHEGRDHLAVLPEIREHGLFLNAAMDIFCQFNIAAGRPWQVPDPRTRAALGGGMFNLVRRSAYDRTPGLPWLRLEIADDFALAQMLKQHGARSLVMDGVGAVILDFYRDLGEMARGTEKSGYAVIGHFNPAILIVTCVILLVTQVGFLAGFLHPALWVKLLAAGTLAIAGVAQALMAKWMKRSVLPALLFPIGILLITWMFLRSGILVWQRGGVAWRSTVYSVRELRNGSRVILGPRRGREPTFSCTR